MEGLKLRDFKNLCVASFLEFVTLYDAPVTDLPLTDILFLSSEQSLGRRMKRT